MTIPQIKKIAVEANRVRSVKDIARSYRITPQAIHNLIFKLRKYGVKIPRAWPSREGKIRKAVAELKKENRNIFKNGN